MISMVDRSHGLRQIMLALLLLSQLFSLGFLNGVTSNTTTPSLVPMNLHEGLNRIVEVGAINSVDAQDFRSDTRRPLVDIYRVSTNISQSLNFDHVSKIITISNDLSSTALRIQFNVTGYSVLGTRMIQLGGSEVSLELDAVVGQLFVIYDGKPAILTRDQVDDGLFISLSDGSHSIIILYAMQTLTGIEYAFDGLVIEVNAPEGHFATQRLYCEAVQTSFPAATAPIAFWDDNPFYPHWYQNLTHQQTNGYTPLKIKSLENGSLAGTIVLQNQGYDTFQGMVPSSFVHGLTFLTDGYNLIPIHETLSLQVVDIIFREDRSDLGIITRYTASLTQLDLIPVGYWHQNIPNLHTQIINGISDFQGIYEAKSISGSGVVFSSSFDFLLVAETVQITLETSTKTTSKLNFGVVALPFFILMIGTALYIAISGIKKIFQPKFDNYWRKRVK
ncbi:MAG: hypothetical protein IH840_00280 [Candidatus Heimdallarchaeota archaeon]|nr:hypothetical protein [Candidatus Heimdallarchaeota archaeon]